jgi:hypothetical protein
MFPLDHVVRIASLHLIGPNLEALQCVGSERRCDRNISGITATRHQDTTDARHRLRRAVHSHAKGTVVVGPGVPERRGAAAMPKDFSQRTF